MIRVLGGLAAWLGGTAAAAPAPAAPPPASPPAPSAPARPAPAPSSPAARRPAPAPSPAGQARSYTLDGGQVTLLVTSDSAQLVTAVPEPGFTVQDWSGPDWLRVDFSSGTQVSSLIASWNGHAPSVTVTN